MTLYSSGLVPYLLVSEFAGRIHTIMVISIRVISTIANITINATRNIPAEAIIS